MSHELDAVQMCLVINSFDIGLDANVHDRALIMINLTFNYWSRKWPVNHIDLPRAFDHLSLCHHKAFDTVRWVSLLCMKLHCDKVRTKMGRNAKREITQLNSIRRNYIVLVWASVRAMKSPQQVRQYADYTRWGDKGVESVIWYNQATPGQWIIQDRHHMKQRQHNRTWTLWCTVRWPIYSCLSTSKLSQGHIRAATEIISRRPTRNILLHVIIWWSFTVVIRDVTCQESVCLFYIGFFTTTL
jgi:hypothetical protein